MDGSREELRERADRRAEGTRTKGDGLSGGRQAGRPSESQEVYEDNIIHTNHGLVAQVPPGSSGSSGSKSSLTTRR